MFKSKNTTGTAARSSDSDVYYPHANRPSMAQRVLEILSLLIILAASVLWLGGVMAIFLAIYAVALGLLGLFAWPRRHAWTFVILAIILILALIVLIILVATNNARVVPFSVNRNQNIVTATTSVLQTVVATAVPTATTAAPVATVTATAVVPAATVTATVPFTTATLATTATQAKAAASTFSVTVPALILESFSVSHFNGSRILVYIVAPILMVLLLLAIPFAFMVAREQRWHHDKFVREETTTTTVRHNEPAARTAV